MLMLPVLSVTGGWVSLNSLTCFITIFVQHQAMVLALQIFSYSS